MSYDTRFEGSIGLSRKLTFIEARDLLELNSMPRQELRKLQNPLNEIVHWVPSETLDSIVWDGSEKFYDYESSLIWILRSLRERLDIIANGSIFWQGEEVSDSGELRVVNSSLDTYSVGRQTTPEYPLTMEKLSKMVFDSTVARIPTKGL